MSTRTLLPIVTPFPANCTLTPVGDPAETMLLCAVRLSAPGGARAAVWALPRNGALRFIGESEGMGKDNSACAVAYEDGTVRMAVIEADAGGSGTTQKQYVYDFPNAIPPFTRGGGGTVDATARAGVAALDARLDRSAVQAAEMATALKG